MAPLAPAELLSVWEHAYGRAPLERALVFLSGAFPGQSLDELLQWPLGYRDRQIARLRQGQFGRIVRSVSECPRCGEAVEFEMDLQQCFSQHAAIPAPMDLVVGGNCRLTVRPLRTADLVQLRLRDRAAPRRLLERCLVVSGDSAEPAARRAEPLETANDEADLPDADRFASLSAEDWSAISRTLEEIDPEARIEVALACPACAAEWNGTFDIAAIFWAELNAWARRTLQEVHAIASRYGWSEREILRLSPWRRRIYLGLVGAL